MAKTFGKVAVVGGLGYVGLPLAMLAKEKGWDVICQDIDQKKIAQANRGVSPLRDAALVASFKKYPVPATADYAAVADADVIVITVPTPVTGKNQPDLRPLKSAIRGILPHVKAGQAILVESTVNPGVMDEVVVPMCAERGDLVVDADNSQTKNALYIAYCPERINPGDPTWSVRNIPRVLGGYSHGGIKRALKFYQSIIEAPIQVMDNATEAEAVKIMENTFRDINIAYVNEMARSFDRLGINITNVIRGASTKPFGFLPHYPGAGVGGHCISVDPYYMIERARDVGFDHHFLKLAREINNGMPGYTVERLLQGLKTLQLKPQDIQVALLGISYKPNVSDARESPATEIRKILTRRNIAHRVFDPHVPDQSTVASLTEAMKGADAVILATAHEAFTKKLTPKALAAAGVKLVVDGRNCLAGQKIAQAGVLYQGIGQSYTQINERQSTFHSHAR